MTIYPLDKPSYFLFQNSASEVSYASEIIIILWIWIWTKWQISVLAKIHILLSFYLILTRGPIIIVKNYLRVISSWRMLFEVAFRCMFYYSFGKKNHGDPYYESTIMVHDSTTVYYDAVKTSFHQKFECNSLLDYWSQPPIEFFEVLLEHLSKWCNCLPVQYIIKYSFYITQPPYHCHAFILGSLCKEMSHNISLGFNTTSMLYLEKVHKQVQENFEIFSIIRDCNEKH